VESQAERHRHIVKAVEAGDPLQAARVLTTHVLNTEDAEHTDFLSLSTQLAALSND